MSKLQTNSKFQGPKSKKIPTFKFQYIVRLWNFGLEIYL
jgi:hypothetical protein